MHIYKYAVRCLIQLQQSVYIKCNFTATVSSKFSLFFMLILVYKCFLYIQLPVIITFMYCGAIYKYIYIPFIYKNKLNSIKVEHHRIK